MASGGGKGGGKGAQASNVDVNDIRSVLDEQARLNRINVQSPMGSVTFQPSSRTVEEPDRFEFTGRREDAPRNPSTGEIDFSRVGSDDVRLIPGRTRTVPGTPTANIALSPNQQALLDRREQLALGLLDNDLGSAETSASDAAFNRRLRLLEPAFEQAEESLTQRLANQGLPVGSEAFEDDFRSFNVGRDQTLADIADRAVLAGQTERNQRLAEIAQLLNPGLTSNPIIFNPSPVDVTGPLSIGQNREIANAQIRQENIGGLFELGGTLGAAAILACDRDLKSNARPVERILPRIGALKVEAWDYNSDGSTHIGPYADQFRELFGVGDGKTIHAVDAIGVCLLGIKELIERTDGHDSA